MLGCFSLLIFLSTLSLRRATLFRQNYECFKWIFLSTLSLRRATWVLLTDVPYGQYFYPRSPCGERHGRQQLNAHLHKFLSTLSLRRATVSSVLPGFAKRLFLSTLSLRRATQVKQTCRAGTSISIHALLAESDDDLEPSTTRRLTFLSTLSLRRATI